MFRPSRQDFALLVPLAIGAGFAIRYIWKASVGDSPRTQRSQLTSGTASSQLLDATAVNNGELGEFEAAAAHARTVSSLPTTTLLRMYALYKQGTVGKCKTQRPALHDVTGRAKWDSWHQLGDMTQEAARQAYVELVDSACPGWRGNSPNVGGAAAAPAPAAERNSTSMAPRVSVMAAATESSIVDVGSFIQSGNATEVLRYLERGGDPNHMFETGETLLHWATDSGHKNIVEILVEHGARVNATTEDGHETPLMYALAAEHAEIAQYLITKGADITVENADGETVSTLYTQEELAPILSAAYAKP